MNESPTLERQRELDAIRHVLDEARAGRGGLLVIEGPSGIGKSRLVAEARELALESGLDVLHARGGELERDYPFGVVLRLLEARFARSSEEEGRRLSRGRAALAAPLLVRGDDGPRHAATSEEFELVHGLYWCVVNVAEERPAALLVDDVHWADELSLRFLVYLAQRLEDLPVALIVAVRTGDPSAESELVARLSSVGSEPSLRPGELSLDAVRELLAATPLPAARNDQFVQACRQATGGNPFLLRELAVALRTDPDAWRNADPARLEAFAPQSVGRSVIVRLTRLGPDALRLARACAVLGEETPLPTVARLAGLDAAEAVTAAERLLAAQILAGTDPASFAHPMIRSAVYDELPPGARPQAHAAAARLLSAEGVAADRVAHHLLAGPPIEERWAREALHDGARVAARKGAPGTAVRCLRRALDLCPPAERSAAMFLDLGMVEAAAGETTSLARFEQALAGLEDPGDQARALYALGRTLYRSGRQDEAARTFRDGVELFEGRDRELALMFEGAYIYAAAFVVSLHAEVTARLESLGGSIPDDRAPSPAERVLLAALATHRALTGTPARDTAALARRALGGGALLREQTAEGIALSLAIGALVICDRAGEAQVAVDDMLADARARGAAVAFAEASHLRGLVMYARGRVADAMADAQAAVEGIERGWRLLGPGPQALLGQCLVERGRVDLAEAALGAVEPVPGTAAGGVNAYLYCARSRVALLRGDARAAYDEAMAAGRLLEPYRWHNPGLAPWRSLAGVAAHAAGDREEALRLIDEEVALARDFELRGTLGAALRARGVVEGSEETLAEAITVLEEADAPLELARALVELGSAYRRAGRRVDCREPLRRALALAHECGATALERRAHDELLASGARPRRAAISGLDALTPSERRIAELAAAGHSNRGIAESLFLTKNTVEWHLRHVYRKLDVASREALRARLGERPAAANPSHEPVASF